MKLTLISKQGLTGISLPEKYAGRYRLRGRNTDGKLIDIVSAEAVRSAGSGAAGHWEIKSNRRFSVTDREGNALPCVTLEPLELYRIKSADGSLRFTLFTEPLTADRRKYKGYTVPPAGISVPIGRGENNGICFSNKFVSENHAELVFSKNGVFVTDKGSTNGTFVNGRAVQKQQLSAGDTIYIMGLQIIVVNNGIFLNDPDGMTAVKMPGLTVSSVPAFVPDGGEFEEVCPEYYYRAPRFRRETETFRIKIDAPPGDQTGDDMPVIMTIGPSVTMGLASVASGIFTFTNALGQGNPSAAVPSLVMCASMLLGTLMWPMITKSYQKRLKTRKEEKRRETYTAYLDGLEQIIQRETARQEQILRDNGVSAGDCAARILEPVPRIWERTPKHSDFLALRLGRGSLPLKAEIQYPERQFTVERDDLTEIMYQFGEKERLLKNVPVTLSLTGNFICGVYGGRNAVYSYARNLILQLVTLHSYDEVKLVLLCDDSDIGDFSFVRWLPHTMNDERTVRYIASGSDEAKELSSALDPIIEYRKDMSEERVKDEGPYFVVFCIGKEPGSKAEFVRRVSEHKKNIGFSVISVCEQLSELPKECTAVARIGDGESTLTVIGEAGGQPVPFTADEVKNVDLRRVTDVLANTFINTSGSDFSLPKKYTFFEMLDIGMAEHLNLAENWKTNDPTGSLAAAVGIDRYGELFRLDLHERAHGPHGLVAGMTGSGKSEFIISYILSMAVSFHPYEVAFILIDYKGGGMAKSFENIPHTAGVITNLDGNGIRRSLSSMRSELHRRERIFRDTSKKHNVSNIDIYKYQKLYREGRVSEPLPHLFIISDEFAELKKEQPEFMTELTSTARIGRSLGVHLILATQKPGGVVDDQIRSNSRFKICLKVQDSGDSQEMLGKPDAAALVDTGRFYLQVGYDELFEIGQSAWAGAPYYPSQKTLKDPDDAVTVINTCGRVVAEANTNRFAAFSDPPKQLDVITKYIADYCAEEKISSRKMWLDPIPAFIYVDKLTEKYKDIRSGGFELAPVVGELDDPENQLQDILRVPITSGGNVIIYGSAGSGKEMFLEAMCYSLMREHTPREVNLYIMDLGAETFSAFAESPFVGDVIYSHEKEKADNLFKLLLGKAETRKKLLSGSGGSMIRYNEQSDAPEPAIVVIINNFAAFTELFEEKSDMLLRLTREGTKYGIYFVLTCTGANNVRFNLMQNFGQIYCLQFNNPDDYSAVVGKTGGFTPEKIKGRGMLRRGKDSLLEFQTARVSESDPAYAAIRDVCRELAEKYSDMRAARIPVLPERVTEQFLAPHAKAGDLSCVPIGVERSALKICRYDFSAGVVDLVLSQNQEWQGFADALGLFVSGRCGIKTIVLSPPGRKEADTDSEKLFVCGKPEDCVSAVNDIFGIVLERNNEYKDKLAGGSALPKYEPVLVIIQSVSAVKTILERFAPAPEKRKTADDTPFNRLNIAMTKCAAEYNVHFVVCESVGALARFSSEEWYRAHVSENKGIWIGNGISSQFRITVSRKPREYTAELKPGFGFVIENSSAVLIKFLK